MFHFTRSFVTALALVAAPGLSAAVEPKPLEPDRLDKTDVVLADEAFDRTKIVLEAALEAVRGHEERAGKDNLRDAFVRQHAGWQALERGEVANAIFLTLSARLAARQALEATGTEEKPALARAEDKALTARVGGATPPAVYLIEAQDEMPAAEIILKDGLTVLKRPSN